MMRRPRPLAKRIGLAAATAFIAINIWTGAPLLALWVGSRAVGQTTLSMTAVMIVVGVLVVVDVTMVALLARLNQAYRDLLGFSDRRRPSWPHSVSGDPIETLDERTGVTPVEQIVTICVYAAVGAFLVWFVFFAGSPLPQ